MRTKASDGIDLSRLQLIDFSHTDPCLNYALDEALQQVVGLGAGPDLVRLWEPLQPTVYIGRFQSVAKEIKIDSCRADRVTIIRRHSGGGAVYSDRGILNVSIMLPLDIYPELADIPRSYSIISDWLGGWLADCDIQVEQQGISDLTINGLKVGGQAQSRKYRCLLHQTSLVFGIDMERMERYLAMPERMPEYRQGRSHRNFVTQAGFPKLAVFRNYCHTRAGSVVPGPGVEAMAWAGEYAKRYQDTAWTFKR